MGGGVGRTGDLYFEATAPVAGQIANIVVNITAASIDLATIGPLTVSSNNSDQTPPDNAPGGCIGHYVRFEAVGCTIALNFGANNAAVSNANAPNVNTTSTISTTNNNLVSAGVPLQAGSYKEWLIHTSSRFMGYVATSGSGSIVISVSSRGM